METDRRKPYLIGWVIIIALAAIGGGIAYWWQNRPNDWTTHTNKTYGIEVSYPSGWTMEDYLTASSTCCIFIADEQISTTTTRDKNGTTTKVTAREMIKLQVGPYDRAVYDPFKAATTTKISLGGNDFYSGKLGAMEFYLLPLTDRNGIGAAIYPYTETPPADMDIAKDIISTIKYAGNQ